MHRALLVALASVMLVPLASAATEVKALGGFFEPASLDLVVGEEVVWTNEDSMPHTVTSTWDEGASFDAVVRGGESFSWTFGQTGDFVVHCRPHAYPAEDGSMEGMAMTIRVGPLESVGSIGEGANQTPGVGLALLTFALVGATMIFRSRRVH